MDNISSWFDSLIPWYNWFATNEGGLFLWGLYSRCLGIMFIISLYSLSKQICGLAGTQGITQASSFMKAWYRDFGYKAYYWWPTVYWITGASDLALRLVPLFGVICGLGALNGGIYSTYFLFGCWLTLLSIDNGPVVLIYPWDSLLCEIGFLSIWLPSTNQSIINLSLNSSSIIPQINIEPITIENLSISSLPTNLYAWAFRWIIFRLLFGFGKLKFMGTQWRDRLYIKNFLLTQPMISPIGMYSYYYLSNFLWIFSLFMMFIIEIVFPLTQLFYDGIHRICTAFGIIILMIGINVAGNFGYFNSLTAIVCIPLIHHSAGLTWTLQDIAPETTWNMLHTLSSAFIHDIQGLQWKEIPLLLTTNESLWLWSVWRPFIVGCFILAVQIPGGFVQFIMNSWVNLGWIFWPGIERASIILRLPLPYVYRKYNEITKQYTNWLLSTGIDINLLAPIVWYTKFLRLIAPFRTVQAYGVFPPQTSPPQRWACVFEGSVDGLVWKRYEYMYYISSPKTPPRFIAPHHPRLDHAIFYESLGLNGSNFLCNFGHHLPYSWFVSCTPWQRLQIGLLNGDEELFKFFRVNPFPNPQQPPKYVRGLICHYLPASVDHVNKTNEYWIERKMGLHLPPLSLSTIEKDSKNIPYLLSDACPVGAEDFWWENIHWRVYAEKSTGVVTKQEYEEVWTFLEDVRNIALEVANEKSSVDNTVVTNVDDTSKSTKSRRSTSRSRKANTSTTTTNTDNNDLNNKDNVRCIAHIVNEQYIRYPVTDQERQLIHQEYTAKQTKVDVKKKKSTVSSNEYSSIDVKAASAILQWIYTPDVVLKLREKYTLLDLIRIRITLNRLILPIIRICYRLFQRITPSKAQLLDELRSVDGLSKEFCDLYLQLPVMVDGIPLTDYEKLLQQQSSNSTNTVPNLTKDGYPIYSFAGNIAADMKGCLRGPLQWGMYGHYLCLVGGRQVYETAIGGTDYLNNYILNKPIATGFTGIGKNDWIATSPLPILFRQLITMNNDLTPWTMGIESGTYLLVLLCYDTWVDMAIGYHRLTCQSRPSKDRLTNLPATLPAFLHLVTRLLAHPRMRIRHVPSISRDTALNANGRLRSKEMDSPQYFGTGLEMDSNRPLCVEAEVPLWKPSEDETDYTFHGTTTLRTRI